LAETSFPYLEPDFKRRFRAQAESALKAAAFPRVLQHRGSFMHLDFAACRGLDPAQFKLLAAFAHHADAAGECRVLQSEIAAEMGISASTVCRWTAELVHRGCLTRTRIGGGSYRYRIAARFLAGFVPAVQSNSFAMKEFVPEVQINFSTVEKSNLFTMNKSNSHQKTASNPKGAGRSGELHPVKSGIAHAASADSGAPASAPAFVVPSSELRSSEGEQEALSADLIPIGWEAAAAAERGLAGLGPVNLRAEWRKLVAYSEGARITIWRWRGWALKARADGSRSSAEDFDPRAAFNLSSAEEKLPGDERQQRQARDWVLTGFWLRSGTWGPAPDMPGCSLPAALVRWCRRERAAAA